MIEVEIDKDSGFCFGVVTAIESAERELGNTDTLYCLGDIVHNSLEVERLEHMGLHTIDHDGLSKLRDRKVLLRAHGEPPSTYSLAKRNNITIIDATCPVVLRLQLPSAVYCPLQRQQRLLRTLSSATSTPVSWYLPYWQSSS